MKYKIGDADELADQAQELLFGKEPGGLNENDKLYVGDDSEHSMELGDLQREVAAAWQKPYTRLHGLYRYEISKQYKVLAKKTLHDRPRMIANAIKYEITDEIIDYLRASVERGNQRALATALWNAKPRHYNMWLEMRDPYSAQGTLLGWHITTMTEVMNEIGNRDGVYRGKRRKVEAGNCFSFERYYQVNSDHLEEDLQHRDAMYRYRNDYTSRHVGIDPTALTTDIWSKDGPLMTFRHTDETRKSDRRHKALMFLGDLEGEFSPDLFDPIVDRWGQGMNNLIEDRPENVQLVQRQLVVKHKMSWVIALLSLMNYDYFVEEPQVMNPQGIKVKRKTTPHDSHIRVKLLLPKTKGRVIVPKQPKRHESYGVRLHDVAGHKRHYRDANGIVYKVVDIRPHQRGDAKLGVITKDYVVEKDKNDG